MNAEAATMPADMMVTSEVVPGEAAPMGGALGIVVSDTSEMHKLSAQVNQAAADPMRVVDHPPVKKFVVRNPNGIDVNIGAGKTLLRQGKIVDSVTYNIDRLLSMGVMLEEVPV